MGRTFCSYGCRQEAKYKFLNGKLCCSPNWHSCPIHKKRNGQRKKKEWSDPIRVKKQKESVQNSWKDHNVILNHKKGLFNYYKNETLEQRKERKKRMRKTFSSKEYKETMSKAALLFWKNPIYQQHRREGMNKIIKTIEYRKAIGEGIRRFHRNNPDFYIGKQNPNYGNTYSIETRKILHDKALLRYKDPIFLEKLGKTRRTKPNKLERLLIRHLNKWFPNEWKYVGNFEFWLGGKNPDFLNINGQKKLIEFFGEYWHKKEEEPSRIKHFKKYGFQL